MTRTTVEEVCIDALDGLAVLEGAPFQSSAGWWRCVVREGLPTNTKARFLLLRQMGEPALLLALKVERGRSSALTTPYTCLYQPPASRLCDFESAGAALGSRLGPVIRWDGIDPSWPGWAGLLCGLRRAGYRATWFDRFANWYEPLEGRTWSAYLAGRPGALRETIRRRLGQAERDPAIIIAMEASGPAALAGVDDYETVHARSWKTEEPHAGFSRAFAAEAEAAGCLRVTILKRDGIAIAAQYWTVERKIATVHKLAHDDSAGARSPGTVLTAWTIRRLIEDGVTEIDFGRGDDAYKSLWTTKRRVRLGLIAANLFTPSGSAALARQGVGRIARRIARVRG